MKPIKKVAIVTTRQNYKWLSMQEVLPGIELCWQHACDGLGIAHRTLNVDVEPFRSYAKDLLESDLLIIIAFNETIARFMRHARLSLGLEAPFVLHLYGHGTLALWPQARFGALAVMNSGDRFIGTCPGDLRCMELTCHNALTSLIPYPHVDKSQKYAAKEVALAYIGRISDQKNIQVLIKAYALLIIKKPEAPPLWIYGKEDQLGSPNMGEASSLCLSDLLKLTESFGLSGKVIFKGFKDREEIFSELGSDHIFVSASTHSDENFGMALMRSLDAGALAVVSQWGGHKVFKEHMPEAVFCVPVDFVDHRPLPRVEAFASAMEEALSKLKQRSLPTRLAPYFKQEAVVKEFAALLCLGASSPKSALLLSQEAKRVHEQQQAFEKRGFIQRAFSGYEDPLAQLFLKAYL